MSIEKLEKAYKDYLDTVFEEKRRLNIANSSFLVCLASLLIPILKSQSNELADLRQKLAKKEDAIDIGDVIKEARLRNG